jgi:hypothetical protein
MKKTYVPSTPRSRKLKSVGGGTINVSGGSAQNVPVIEGHTHDNKIILDAITQLHLRILSSLNVDEDGALIVELSNIIKELDTTAPTDENLFSALRTILEIRARSISKTDPDTAQEIITFLKGIIASGTSKFDNIEVGDYTTGPLGAGAAIKMENGVSRLEVDNLDVRMRATFRELIIESLKHIGGQLVLSPARMKCVAVADGGSYYRCYFDNDGGAISNEFVAGDQARCEVFTGSGTKFYWRLVTSVGDDWINLSKTDAVSGSDIPEAGDEIVQLGHRTDTTRQNAQILSTVGPDAPSWKQYKGINSFSLEGKDTTVFSGTGNKIEGKTVFVSSGSNLDDYLDATAQDIQDAQAAANAAALLAQQAIDEAEANVTLINQETAKLQAQIDGEVSNWFYPYSPTLANYPASDWTTNEIKDRHIGDTFTNTQTYVDNETTPDAGKSWRFVKNGSTYSWTVIADSDAVLALQKAAQAQATADGKSTTFLIQPTSYKLGDMWVLNADRTVNGTAYKQGEILTATQDSTTFNEAHWLKRVRYTDDTAVNNLQIGGRNLFSVNDFVADNKARGYSTIEVINYNGNIAYRSSSIVNNHNIPRYLQGKFEANTQYYLQFKINWESYTNSGAQYIFTIRYTDGTLSNLYATTSQTSRSMLTASGKTIDYITTTRQYDGTVVIYEVQIEKANKPSDWSPAPEDVQAEIDAEKTRINDILSDNIADPSEKQYLSNLWQEIYAEYPRIWAQADTYAVDKSNYEAKYTALNNLLSPVLANLTTNSTVSGASIRTAFSQYYDARTFLLNNITNKVNTIAADAQAKANISKAVTDKFRTTIDGGLISTVMVLLRELNSQQDTAGISGIQGALKNQPAFWSGGKYEQAIGLIEFLHHMSEGTPPGTGEGQFDYQAKYQQLAPVAILHNGAAKVGDFLVLESGRIAMIDPSTGIPRLVFSVTDLPLIEDLISEIEDTGTVSNDSQNNVRGSYIFPNGINIEKNDSRLRFVLNWNSYLYVDGGDWGADGMVSFVLLRNGVYYDLISEFYALADPYETASEQLYTVKDFESLPAGYYTVQATVQDLSGMDAVWADIGSSQLTYYFKLQGVRRQQYGRDGMMFYYSDHHFHFTEGGGLDGRALPDKWNAPGVLLSATILANGGWNRVWGAKQSPTPPPAPSPTGRYTIYHTIGHTNYQVNCISYTENRSFRVYAKNTNSVVVECRTIGSSPTLSNAMFDITLTGNNY